MTTIVRRLALCAFLILCASAVAQQSKESSPKPAPEPPKSPTTPAPSAKPESTLIVVPDEKPLGDVAREKKKTAAKKAVLDEETISTTQHPIPAIYTGGVNNWDEIVKAVDEYHATHTANEFENALRAWYADNDSTMANAIAELKRIENALPPDVNSQYEYEVAVRDRRTDLVKRKEYGLLIARIQQTFQHVRNHLRTMGVTYDWFKIRCGNGNCSY
jgi:hypothetical protein